MLLELLIKCSTVEDSCVLELHTWYMTKENYQEMREGKITEIMVPLLNRPYKLPIVTSLYHGGSNRLPKCYFKAPFHKRSVQDRVRYRGYPLVYTYKNYVLSTRSNSGIYTVICKAKNWDYYADYTGKNWTVALHKRIRITFFKGDLF